MTASAYTPTGPNFVTLVEHEAGTKPPLSERVRVGMEYLDLNGVTWKINSKSVWIQRTTAPTP